MLLWPNRLEIFNHTFRPIKTGTNNAFDGKELKRHATVLEINPCAPMTQYTVFAFMAKRRAYWILQLSMW